MGMKIDTNEDEGIDLPLRAQRAQREREGFNTNCTNGNEN
jgi:hypothetical protein